MFYLAATFFALLVTGRYLDELRWAQVLLCLSLAGAVLGAFILMRWPAHLYAIVLAAFDVGLVLKIFKGDILIR